MSAEQPTTPSAHAAELLARDQDAHAAEAGPLRGALRRLLLRAMRPYTHHQRVLDGEILSVLRQHEALLERDGERLDRLDGMILELIQTAEALRRVGAGADRDARAAKQASDETGRSLQALAAELNDVPYMEGDPFTAFDSPVGEVVGFRDADALTPGESDYVAFEDLFRGSGERVRETQRAYLPLLADPDAQPVLDIGCGRGELLALLAGEGIAASGVDIDAGMVKRCVDAGLQAVQGDANTHLQGLDDASLGTVFSAQVIEHLPFAELQRLLALARAKLRPGGLFIAETVNPHRIASLKTFWVDPTHQHPIFPEVALALCAIAGFAGAYVFTPGFQSFEEGRLRAPAYAVVATTGGPGGNGAEAD